MPSSTTSRNRSTLGTKGNLNLFIDFLLKSSLKISLFLNFKRQLVLTKISSIWALITFIICLHFLFKLEMCFNGAGVLNWTRCGVF
jgi:hypothetical protein